MQWPLKDHALCHWQFIISPSSAAVIRTRWSEFPQQSQQQISGKVHASVSIHTCCSLRVMLKINWEMICKVPSVVSSMLVLIISSFQSGHNCLLLLLIPAHSTPFSPCQVTQLVLGGIRFYNHNMTIFCAAWLQMLTLLFILNSIYQYMSFKNWMTRTTELLLLCVLLKKMNLSSASIPNLEITTWRWN